MTTDQPLLAQHARLLALHDDVQPQSYILEADICTIGRSPVCQVVVGRNLVSRLHARIERDSLHYVLHDAGSANGTFVNCHRIHGPHLLANNDQIGLGAPGGLLRFVDPDPTFVPTHRLRYDERAMAFAVGQQPLDLTPAQFRLLLYLYQHAGDLCTRESCAEALWGRDYDPGLDADALDRAISSLRVRLREADPAADFIETRRGLGYTLSL
jgi:DNA-binding response OmpR family regulator